MLSEEKAFLIVRLMSGATGGLVRYRTAAILSVTLIGGMFGLPAVAMAVLRPYMEQGVAIPIYERILFGVAVFCLSFRWLLALPILSVLFTVAAFTHSGTPSRR
jgi:hypothetical protein